MKMPHFDVPFVHFEREEFTQSSNLFDPKLTWFTHLLNFFQIFFEKWKIMEDKATDSPYCWSSIQLTDLYNCCNKSEKRSVQMVKQGEESPDLAIKGRKEAAE